MVDWSTKKPNFIYGPLDNRTKMLIEPKVGKNEVKLRAKIASPNKLLNIAMSSRPSPTVRFLNSQQVLRLLLTC